MANTTNQNTEIKSTSRVGKRGSRAAGDSAFQKMQGSVRIIPSDGKSIVATTQSDISVTVRTIFTDLKAGSVDFEPLFGDRSNIMFLVRQYRSDAGVQGRISEFYRSLKIGEVITSLLPQSYVKPMEVHFSATEFLGALKTVGGLSDLDALVVADQLIPPLRNAGFTIAVPERYVTRAEHPRELPTVADLKADVAAQHCAAIMDKVKFSTLATTKYGRKVLAEMLAVDLRHAGARMLTQAAYGKVVDCMSMGIRARLDLSNEALRAAIPQWLRDHPVIEEMSENLTFLISAFGPGITKDSKIDVDTDDLKNYLDVLAASLKSSTRYSCVSIKSMLEEYSLKHAFDYNDEVAMAMMTHNVPYEAGVMAAMPTVVGSEVQYLDESDSRVAELLMAHDQGLFSLTEAADACFATRSQLLMDNAFWKPGVDKPYLTVVSLDDEPITPDLLLSFVASERVTIAGKKDAAGRYWYTSSGPDAKANELPNFVFHVKNDGKRLPIDMRNRMLDRDFIITQDTATVALLASAFDSKRPRRSAPQLPPHSVLGARLLAVPANIVQKLNTGVQYSMEVGSNRLEGTFFLKSIDSMQIGRSQGIMINPTNASVTATIGKNLFVSLEGVHDDIRKDLAYNAPIYRYIVKLSQRLSRAFREDVHSRIISQAMPGVTEEESAAMRAIYNRSLFAVQVDVFALRVYLEAVGCERAAALIGELAEDEAMQIVMSQEGSDRRKV